MKEEKTKSKKRWVYYLILGISVLLLVAATVLTVYFVTQENNTLAGGNITDDPTQNEPSQNEPSQNEPSQNEPSQNEPSQNQPSQGDEGGNSPSGGDALKFVSPIDHEGYSVEYNAIYANLTAKRWYRHKAIDFKAEAGTEVRCMADGVVKDVSISKELGNLIVIDHGDGLQTYYRFIEPAEDLTVGKKVAMGEKIGTVAEAYGSEAFDGAHLHLEMFVNGTPVDPTEYLDPVLDEK